MAQKRAHERDLEIPLVANPEQRARAELDLYFALRTYFPERFYLEFTEDQCEMIQAILNAAKFGGDQALAAARGDGKTTIAECVIAICICLGILRFPLIVAATGRDAEQILANIKGEFEMNAALHADFPEVCHPVWALEGAPQRCGGQTVKGTRTRMQWSGDRVVFPTVEGSKASGAILMTRGLDGSMRGARHAAQRPDLVLVDDPDTDESAVSPTQQEKREETIDRAIGGMAGPGKSMARVMLCTLMNRTCLAARYTDPLQKPSWRGKRFRFLAQMPTRDDLWGEFVRLRQAGFDPNTDVEISAAHEFYLANRELMDTGAQASNPNRFNPLAFPPETSSLEHFYNEVADKSWPAVLTELQNDPPADVGPESSGITYGLVAKRLSGFPMNVVPRGRMALTSFIDVGYATATGKGCHFITIAWLPGARGHVVEYGVQDVHNVETLGPQLAIRSALQAWRDERLQNPYVTEDGEPARVDLALVDSGDGNLETMVYQFCRDAGNQFRPAKGFGSRHGQSPFHGPPKQTKERRPGDHLYESWQAAHRVWLVGIDADHWKRWVHDRFLTAPRDENGGFRAGGLTLFGEDEKRHTTYGHHIVAEMEESEFVRGKGMVTKWVVKNRNNDWFDCTAGASAAASLLGVRLSTSSRTVPTKRRVARVTGGWPAAMQKGFA